MTDSIAEKCQETSRLTGHAAGRKHDVDASKCFTIQKNANNPRETLNRVILSGGDCGYYCCLEKFSQSRALTL